MQGFQQEWFCNKSNNGPIKNSQAGIDFPIVKWIIDLCFDNYKLISSFKKKFLCPLPSRTNKLEEFINRRISEVIADTTKSLYNKELWYDIIISNELFRFY